MIDRLEDLRAIIYTRKSTVSDGKSTGDQECECRHWCETQHIPVERVICDEGISASRYGKKPRDGWTELKALLQPGHILVAWEASRATRDVGEWVAIRNLCAERKVPFAYNGRVLDLTTGDDRFVGGLDALLAEREAEQIRERFMRGKRGAATAGTPPTTLGWGYRPVPRQLGDKRTQWEIDPGEAPRIREAVGRIIDGESLLSVGRWLKSTGYAPATHTSLRRSLTRPAIAGKRIHQGKVIGNATWPPIISEEDRQKVIAALRWDHPNPGPEPTHLCSGIAICGMCGGKLRHHRFQRRMDVYRCNKGCGSRKASMLDSAVEKAVLRRLLNINPNDYASDNPEIAEAERRIQELEDDLKRWQEKAIAEEVSAEMYAQVEKDRKRKIAELRPQTVPARRRLLTHATWADGTIREKRETVRALLNISIPQVKHLGRRATEDDVDITPL
jgi:site-specific DNA recombinase